jgi:uncharacterized protein YebE (UPF0316 family)
VNQLVTAAGMALLAMTSVGLWTLRVALTARGRRGIAAAVAAVEAVVFAVAFTNVASHLDSPARIAGYAAGVAAGTVLGLTVDHHLSAGESEVDIVVPAADTLAVERLRRLGWPATSFNGDGPSGPVIVICVAVDDARVADLTADVRQVAPNAFWTVQRLGTTHASALPEGYLQIAGEHVGATRRPTGYRAQPNA